MGSFKVFKFLRLFYVAHKSGNNREADCKDKTSGFKFSLFNVFKCGTAMWHVQGDLYFAQCGEPNFNLKLH